MNNSSVSECAARKNLARGAPAGYVWALGVGDQDMDRIYQPRIGPRQWALVKQPAQNKKSTQASSIA